jgi:hypothetical protein
MDFTCRSSSRLWTNRGNARQTLSAITGAAATSLGRTLDEAQRIKRDAKINDARKRIIKNIAKRSIVLVERLEDAYLDDNDVKGLIGEMILDDMAEFHDHITICPKWKKTGSSHSNGLDLIAYRETRNGKKLVVTESKHIHESIKNASSKHLVIRDKCSEALDQSDPNHILCSLSDVIAKLGVHLTTMRALGGDNTALEEKYQILQTAFSDSDYELWVCVFVDANYCDDTVYSSCITCLSAPEPEYGDSITIEVVAVKNLEGETVSLRGKFVQ